MCRQCLDLPPSHPVLVEVECSDQQLHCNSYMVGFRFVRGDHITVSISCLYHNHHEMIFEVEAITKKSQLRCETWRVRCGDCPHTMHGLTSWWWVSNRIQVSRWDETFWRFMGSDLSNHCLAVYFKACWCILMKAWEDQNTVLGGSSRLNSIRCGRYHAAE